MKSQIKLICDCFNPIRPCFVVVVFFLGGGGELSWPLCISSTTIYYVAVKSEAS